MKSRIAKIGLSIALVSPCCYGTAHVMRSIEMNDVTEAVKFYAEIPSRVSDAVTTFKRLPERMDPTCSECSEP